MEKVNLGIEMSNNWTDPTMWLIYMVPYAIGCIVLTGYYAFTAFPVVLGMVDAGALPEGDALMCAIITVMKTTLPFLLTWFGYNCYQGWFQDASVDTSKFVTFRDPYMAAYWKHRKIPMCELYEFYIESKCDWNPDCENGDCFLILRNHRSEFVNYKITMRQVYWLLAQFVPTWLCSGGLGYGNSSSKSIEETTKEIDEHYNKGNDVFSCILGRPMVYTCGIFHGMPQFASSGHKGDYHASANDKSLEDAQTNKMDMICDKLQLKEGESLLDIGCGWGTLLRHAKHHYKAEPTGVTLSIEGKIYCDMASEKTGIPTKVLHSDYRNIPQNQQFDKIASIEMAEHVGLANFIDPYLKNVKRLLKNKDSLFLMQVAGLRQGSNWQDVAWGLFMGKYVFPGADASTPLNWYIKQCERAGFEVHSVETIGNHYAHTLHKWYDNWMSHKEEILGGEIDAISEHSKGEHLFRLNELTWAWCAIHAGQGGGTCYQILMNPCDYDFDRDQWVDGQHVSSGTVTGNGYKPMEKTHTPGENPAYAPDWGENLGASKASPAKASGGAKKRTAVSKPRTPAKTPTRTQPRRAAKTPKQD